MLTRVCSCDREAQAGLLVALAQREPGVNVDVLKNLRYIKYTS